MSTFIRATEVWTPSASGKHLDLTSGLYGDLKYFEAISRGMRFEYDEGLPGKTWARGEPIVLKNLANSYFRRGDAAMTEGLTCAVSVPIFVKGEIRSVVVYFCGEDRFSVGALELWTAKEGDPFMRLEDGYFGRAERFEFASRHTSFPKGMGLPGQVWESGLPVIMDDLGRAKQFVRVDSAERIGISRAVGFPVAARDRQDLVLAFLSARNSPIARRFECWTVDPAQGGFVFSSGYCESGIDLSASHRGVVLPSDFAPFASAGASGAPTVLKDLVKEQDVLSRHASTSGLQSMFALPIYRDGEFAAVLASYL